MNKLKVFLLTLVLLLAFSISAEARTDLCYWFWTTSFASTTADPPDAVYCSQDGSSMAEVIATHGQFSRGAESVDITWDTDRADGSTTIADVVGSIGASTVICSNASATVDLNIFSSADGRQYSEGGVWYHTESSLADEKANDFDLTPPSYFKLGATEGSGTAACLIAISSVYWR